MQTLHSPATAVCPEHPERASLAACERCGRFLCELCLASRTPPRCPDCAARFRDPLGLLARTFSLDGSIRSGWMLFTRTLSRSLPIALLIGGLGGTVTYLGELGGATGLSSRVDLIIDSILGTMATGAVLSLMVGEAEGVPHGTGEALKDGLKSWPRLFMARLRAGVWILLYSLLLVIPGIMKAVSFAVTTEAAFREPGRDPLKNSAQLAKGRGWEVFGLIVVCYGFIFLSMLPIGFIGGVAIEMVPSSSLVANIFIDVAGRLVDSLASGVTLAAFYGLKRAQEQELEPLPSSAPQVGTLDRTA